MRNATHQNGQAAAPTCPSPAFLGGGGWAGATGALAPEGAHLSSEPLEGLGGEAEGSEGPKTLLSHAVEQVIISSLQNCHQN